MPSLSKREHKLGDGTQALPMPQLLEQLAWETPYALRHVLAEPSAQTLLRHLSQPVDAPKPLCRIDQIKAAIIGALQPAVVSPQMLCGSLLLSLHLPLCQAVQHDAFCPRCDTESARLAAQLMLSHATVWSFAAELAGYYGHDEELAPLHARLTRLYNGLYVQPHVHPIRGFEELLTPPPGN